MKAVILAGGLGTRLRPFTEIIPKPLLPIGEKSVLEIQIDALKKHGFDEIYLATNYKSDYIENFFGDGSKFGVKLTISKETKKLGTVGPLTLLKDELTEPFLMMNGDILTQLDYKKMYEYALLKETTLTIGIKEMVTPFQFGNIFYEGDYVTGIEEKPNIRTKILAGVYIFKPEIFNWIPDDTYFGMDTLIEAMIAQNEKIAKYEITEYWLDIGQVADYEKAQEIYKEKFQE
ncbi:NTP transferase domain-containing protein [bacterium]|nr:NTP transferase domain-containing protein [bacterium]